MNSCNVSILIVCRNEEQFIAPCISSILAQDIDLSQTEIIFVDGRSDDRTRDIISLSMKSATMPWQIIDNPKRLLAAGWNIGIKASCGEFIIRIDAHSLIPRDFIRKNLSYLQNNPDAHIVGGKWTSTGKTGVGKVLGTLQSSRFGVGNSPFRTGTKEATVETATMAMCRREVYEVTGPFDETLIRSQDLDFYKRAQIAGFVIRFTPEIQSVYFCRNTLSGALRQAWADGASHVKNIRVISVRHLIPFIFVSSLIISFFLCVLGRGFFRLLFPAIIMVYSLTAISISIAAGIKKRSVLIAALLPLFFFMIHVTYGFGTLVTFLRAPYLWQNKMKPHKFLFFGGGVIVLALLLVLGLILQHFPFTPESLIFKHEPMPADAIVFLAGGPAYERIDYAFELAKARFTPVLFTPGGEDVDRIKRIRAEAIRDSALFIFVEGEITTRNSTFGEALSTKAAARKTGWKTILLVTSPEHSRRAFWIFRRVLPKEIAVISCPVPVDKSTFVPDHLTPGTKPWKRFRDEQKKLLWYYIYYGWRWYL